MSHDFILMEVLREDWDSASEDRLAQRQHYLDQRGGIAVNDEDAKAAAIV
jgi:hypothetical protein